MSNTMVLENVNHQKLKHRDTEDLKHQNAKNVNHQNLKHQQEPEPCESHTPGFLEMLHTKS